MRSFFKSPLDYYPIIVKLLNNINKTNNLLGGTNINKKKKKSTKKKNKKQTGGVNISNRALAVLVIMFIFYFPNYNQSIEKLKHDLNKLKEEKIIIDEDRENKISGIESELESITFDNIKNNCSKKSQTKMGNSFVYETAETKALYPFYCYEEKIKNKEKELDEEKKYQKEIEEFTKVQEDGYENEFYKIYTSDTFYYFALLIGVVILTDIKNKIKYINENFQKKKSESSFKKLENQLNELIDEHKKDFNIEALKEENRLNLANDETLIDDFTKTNLELMKKLQEIRNPTKKEKKS